MAKRVIIYILAICFAVISFPLKSEAGSVSKLTIKELIVKHSIEMGLDPAMALSIAKAESNFCHERKSRYGAVGVFQLMPSTAKKMGYNPYKLQENIKGGIEYYKRMYKMFGSDELALAAYNAGPGNVKKYNGVPPFNETKKFVSSIMNSYNNLKANPDPVIYSYKNEIKDINYEENRNIRPEDSELDYRMSQDAVLTLYLSNQGV